MPTFDDPAVSRSTPAALFAHRNDSTQPPIPALPLDYGSETRDPFVPVIKKIALLLFILGILSLVIEVFYVADLARNFGNPTIRSILLRYLLGIPESGIQITAGALNAKRAHNLKWLWVWIWTAITVQVLNKLFEIYNYYFYLPHPSTTNMTIVLAVILRLIEIPLGCALALIVIIILICRRQLAIVSPAS